MATILGTVGVFGFDSDQQGILLESQDIDYKPDSKIQRDYRGVKVGIIFYDDQTDISMKGYIPRENPTDIRVAQTLKLANAIRGLGIAAGSLLPDNQAGAAVKGGLNALNTAGNITRDYLIRRTNDQRRRPHRHPKP